MVLMQKNEIKVNFLKRYNELTPPPSPPPPNLIKKIGLIQ